MRARSLAGAVAALGVALVAPGSVAGAAVHQADSVAESDIDVVNTETVRVYLDSAGKVEEQRVYEQLTLTGDGKVRVVNPVETDGLRNLDGFGGTEVADGASVATYDVDGVLRTRTVSDFGGKLPLDVEVTYLLDGEEVDADEVVGASGELEVRYTVKNNTVDEQLLEIPDGKGGTETRTLPVAVPYAGSLALVLPEEFTDVSSERGVLAGDGRGGTKVSFTLTLFPPIGSPEITLAWKANVTDAVVPRAELMALPVNPMRSPTFATASEGYAKGAKSGSDLAEGANEIDANLLKLRDGAADLLGGLLQLHEGADKLRTGLNGKALDGARRLADGTGAAASGSRDLRNGLARISDGLDQLAEVDGLPAAAEGVDLLQGGVGELLDGFGAVGTTGTLLDGLARLETGLGQLSGGLTQLKGNGSPQTPGLVGAKGGVDQVRAGLTASLQPGGSLDQLVAGLNALKGLGCVAVCAGVIDTQILPGIDASRTQLTQARDGLVQVSGGLGQAITGLEQQLIPGAQEAAVGAGKAADGAAALKAGLGKVSGGLTRLETGLAKALAGVLALDAGAGEAYAGAGDLADGLTRIDDGAGELADGLGDAADGSTRLAEGLGQAADGAPQLVDGAGRLSKEGSSVIAAKGTAAALDYGSLVAVMEAGGERADAEAMAYGAPEGAQGITAYSFVIAGEDGASGRNWTGALTGAALLGMGGGVMLLRRRLMPV